MTVGNLFSLSGLSLILGGLMAFTGWILFAIFDPGHQHYQNPRWFPLNLLIIIGGLLMALGLPGFYAGQAIETGVLGLIGFLLLWFGLVLSHIAVHSIETVTIPNVPATMMRFVSVAAPSLILGILITGILTCSAGVYPASLGISLILAALVGLLTVIKAIPQVIRRNLASTLFPASMVMAGILIILR